LLCGLALTAAALQAQPEVSWSALAPRVDGRNVALALPDATRIEGRVIGVEPEGLRVHVSKSSNRNVVSKGERLIPRPSISLVRIVEHRGKGRLLATLGFAAAAAAVAIAVAPPVDGGYGIIFVPMAQAGGVIGAAIGGYYTGKAIDRRVTQIRVLP
jgi:hypothetical protein